MATVSTYPQHMAHSSWMTEAKERLGALGSAIGKHRVFMLAGSIAYTTALSLAPFVLILLSFASLLGQGYQTRMYEQMKALLGPQAGDAIKMVVEHADNNQSLTTISGIVGLLVLAISASAVFSQLRSSMDIINETPEDKQPSGILGFFKDKFFSVGLVLGFVFLAVISLAVTAFVSGIFSGGEALLWNAVTFVINVLLFTGLFTLMFHYIPTERFSWKHSLISGACGAAFFLIGKYLIGFYLGNASVGSAYGAAGSLVVFLVWVYYSTVTMLVSYEFANHVIIRDNPEIKGVPDRA